MSLPLENSSLKQWPNNNNKYAHLPFLFLFLVGRPCTWVVRLVFHPKCSSSRDLVCLRATHSHQGCDCIQRQTRYYGLMVNAYSNEGEYDPSSSCQWIEWPWFEEDGDHPSLSSYKGKMNKHKAIVCNE